MLKKKVCFTIANVKIWNEGRKTSSNKLHDIPEITQLCVCRQMCCVQFLLEKSAKLQQTGKKKWL